MARILGIDIDRSALRATVLKTAFRRTDVERYIQIPLTQSPESPGRTPEVRDAIANLLRALGKPPDTTISSLDGTHASIRLVELPAAAAKRIAEVLPFELESMLPFEISDAVVDHQPVSTTPTQVRLLAAAALRPHLREHLALFQGSAADPREVAVGAAALEGLRTFCPALATGNTAVLELCESQANVCVLSEGRTVFARTISMDPAATKQSDVEFWQAVRRTFSAYRAAGGAALDALYLCGAGALTDIARFLSDELSMRVEVLTLPAALGMASVDQLDNSPVYARSLALAARATTSQKRINLRKGEFATTRGKTELTSQLHLVALCGVAVLLCLVFSLKARQSVLLDEQATLKKALATTTQSIFGKAENNASAVETLLSGPPSDNPLPRFDAYDALAAISDAVPSEITHEMRHLRIDLADEKKEGQLELQGGLASIDQRDQIVARLESHGCFTDIQRGKTSTGRIVDQINYQIESKVSCPGEGVKTKKRATRGSDE